MLEVEPGRAVGRKILRSEDPRLLRGHGQYVADLDAVGALHAYFVRSPVAHGRLNGVDVATALELPGVRAVVTAGDLDDVGRLPVGWNHPGQRITETALLATDTVRWVGQPVAVVLAESAYAAEDAGDRVELNIDPLNPVPSMEAALADGAARLYPDWSDNVLVEFMDGPGATQAAFDRAAVCLRESFVVQRQAASPMESRAALARFDPDENRVDAWLSTQIAHHAREVIAGVCGWPENELRVITPDVGGGFGLKEPIYTEEVLVCLLARRFSRPVRWIEDRREALIGSSHCRQCEWDLELAADAEGHVLAIRGELRLDIGGQPTAVGIGPGRIAADMLCGPYDIQDFGVLIRGVMTNKAPMGAYRGYGAPESSFARERLMDMLADELGIDRAEIRRRNFIVPSAFPYTTPTLHVYDSGDYEEALDRALSTINYENLAARKATSRAAGRLRGLGICSFVKAAGLPSSRVMGLVGISHGNHETVTVRMDSTGKATVYTGVSSQGQGHRTVLAQVCADALGLDPERDVTVIQGDTAATPYSAASAIASRVASLAGAATIGAAYELRDRLCAIAAHKLEAAPADVELLSGHARVVGSPTASVPIGELAHAALTGFDLPEGMSPGLDFTSTFDPPDATYPFGTHVAEIEVDPRTGAIAIERYVVVNDSGTLLNPMIVEGQICGAVAQGLGGALLEEIVYDARAQILTATFMDYLLPTASEIPKIEIEHMCTPAPNIPGGVKGVGESGCLAPGGALANALADALGPDAPKVDRLPLTPNRVWQLLSGIA